MTSSTQTLVISDIHLGSTLSSTELLMTFLKSISFERIILLGDIFDGVHIRQFKKADWQFLTYLQNLGKSGKEVVWIMGNHDIVEPKNIEKINKIKFVESYFWQYRGKNYCAIHGHQFDRMAIKNSALKKLTGNLHSLFASYMRHKKTALFFAKTHTKIRRLSQKISKGAVDYAAKNNIDYIFCGHTHIPVSRKINLSDKKEINYFNAGSWIQQPFSYVTIDEKGVKINEFV